MAPDGFAWVEDALQQLQQAGLQRQVFTRCGKATAARIDYGGQQMVNFGSNDYLGLAGHDALARAAAEATRSAGVGSGASPLITGRGTVHQQLESELARFESVEAVRLFPTGYAANAGTIPALVGREDAVFSDARNHASIIDGCRLSGARVWIYPHGDVHTLKQQLGSPEAHACRRMLIVTDSLFSMDGDLAPLAELNRLAAESGAMLMVDEAHATGVLGTSGRGACELAGIESSPHLVRVGTLSKALGCMGGFVAGSRALIEWLTNRARPYFFSTAPPEMISAAALEALKLVESEPHRRQELLQRADSLRTRLRADGHQVGTSESQIVPVILGDADRTMLASQRLREAGMFVPGIRPPSVPPGQSLLRISLCYGHHDADLEKLANVLRTL